MMVEENIPNYVVNENHSFPRGAILNLIFKSIENTAIPFINTVKHFVATFSEDKFTQEFVEKNDFQLSKLTDTIGVKTQYKDLIYKTKGIPDIYYHFKEEEGIRKPIFIMEAKVLPAPAVDRNQEYVVGYFKKSGKPAGGIQRFKIEKHGKGHTQCGLLAYVLNDDFDNWLNKINGWIREFQTTGDYIESLQLYIRQEKFIKLISKVYRTSKDVLTLHHFWISIN